MKGGTYEEALQADPTPQKEVRALNNVPFTDRSSAEQRVYSRSAPTDQCRKDMVRQYVATGLLQAFKDLVLNYMPVPTHLEAKQLHKELLVSVTAAWWQW